MLLRTSSTPVNGSPLSPLGDSPRRDFKNNNCTKHVPVHGLYHLNLIPFSCTLSPVSHSASGFSELNQETNGSSLKGFRRARSDGNLEGLAYSSSDIEEFRNSNTQKNSSCKHHNSMLRTSPSFSIYNSFDEENNDQQGLDGDQEPLTRTVTIGDCIGSIGNTGDFSFGKKNMELIQEEGEDEEEGLNVNQNLSFEEFVEPVSPPMYLATGLGIDVAGFDCGEVIDLTPENFDESGNLEEYYKRMVDEYPCHPLFLRNYAQLLQYKGDLHGAEDYYHRATLADPGDGEILLQYAKLVWELHHDQNRASSYFERAAQAAPEDSNVLAAYAGFLWEIENDCEEDTTQKEHIKPPFPTEKEDPNKLDSPVPVKETEPVSPSLHIAPGFRIDVPNFTANDADKGGNAEEYHRRMVEENPSNPLVLRNYAQFLCQSKRDLQGAEEYYSRAILADPADGEIASQYAKLVWELHHDRDKALCYFERAVQATPEDSHVLAAYASFLWETEEEKEDSARQDQFQVPHLHEGAITRANA